MGCDIHFYTERYTSDNDYDGPSGLSEGRNPKLEDLLELNEVLEPRWVSADKWVLDDDFEEPWWSVKSYYRGRNYYLFSVLAVLGIMMIIPQDYQILGVFLVMLQMCIKLLLNKWVVMDTHTHISL